jgi:hypothetical protein
MNIGMNKGIASATNSTIALPDSEENLSLNFIATPLPL